MAKNKRAGLYTFFQKKCKTNLFIFRGALGQVQVKVGGHEIERSLDLDPELQEKSPNLCCDFFPGECTTDGF